MRPLLKYLLPLLFALNASAQVNLVPNGSFEVIDTCPYYISLPSVQHAVPWFAPTKGSSDLFNACDSSNLGAPYNHAGYQIAYEGIGYCGIFLHTPDSPNVNREYIAVRLNDTLEKNKSYCLTMYCSLSEGSVFSGGTFSSFSSSSIGAYFSKDSIFQNDGGLLPYVPQIQNPVINQIDDILNWTIVTGFFTSTMGTEKYMYIGNFFENSNGGLVITHDGLYDNYPWVFVYIDSISLLECEGVAVSESPAQQISLFPNPAANTLTISTGNLQNAQVELFDISGRKLFQQNLTASQQSVDVSGYANGIYICVVTANGKVVRREKIVISH